jgi:hypothetical protein
MPLKVPNNNDLHKNYKILIENGKLTWPGALVLDIEMKY